MQKILGIDLGASAIKAVAIEASFRSHSVRGYRSEPVPPPEPPADGQPPQSYAERAREALEAFARDGWFEADRIICCLPGAQVAAHALSLPFADRKQIDSTLPGEVENLIPFDLDEIVFDSHVATKGPGRTDLIVAVAQRAQVKAVLDQLQAVGVDPAVITFSALSLSNLFTEGYAEASLPEVGATDPLFEAVIDIGAERTSLVILENGEVRFARVASTGGDAVTQALARAMAVPFHEAEEMKRSVDLSGAGDPTMTAVATRAVSGLVREIRSTFSAFSTRTRQKITRLRITGGGARLSGLAPFLADALAIPVEPLELRPDAGLTDPVEAATGALALSLALRGVNGSRAPKLNFRRGDLSYALDVGETRSLYVGLGAMAAVLMVLFCVSIWAKVHALDAREAQLDQTLCDVTKKVLGKCETDYHTTLAKLQGKGSPTAAIPQTSAVGLVVTVGQLFPQGSDTTLSDLDITDGTVLLRGQAKSYDAIDDLVADLQANKCFKEVRKGKLTKTADGKVDFALDATYTCGGLGKEGA